MAITPLMPVYPRSPVRPVRGEGVYLFGEKGEKYLDFASGIAVNLLGHGHPHLTRAIQDQAATLIHVSNLYGSPQGEAFAQRLVDLTFADTVFLTTGRRGGRMRDQDSAPLSPSSRPSRKHELITFTSAFHGRTLGTISATNQDKLRDGFAPFSRLQGRRVRQSRGGHGGDRPAHRRLPGRADPRRGRHPPGQPGIHQGQASLPTSTI
jgi:acetylornithine/N-succinyldiaminopimelate aminotransferase